MDEKKKQRFRTVMPFRKAKLKRRNECKRKRRKKGVTGGKRRNGKAKGKEWQIFWENGRKLTPKRKLHPKSGKLARHIVPTGRNYKLNHSILTSNAVAASLRLSRWISSRKVLASRLEESGAFSWHQCEHSFITIDTDLWQWSGAVCRRNLWPLQSRATFAI